MNEDENRATFVNERRRKQCKLCQRARTKTVQPSSMNEDEKKAKVDERGRKEANIEERTN